MKNSPIFIGVDPGLDGGLACLNSDGQIILKNAMPTIDTEKRREIDVQAVIRFFGTATLRNTGDGRYMLHSVHVFIEGAHAMPDQSAQSGFNYGKGFGIIIGIVSVMGEPLSYVTPQRWQKAMFSDTPHKDTKAVAALICSRLWPKVDVRATEKSRKSHDGICDAVLIAEYARRNYR